MFCAALEAFLLDGKGREVEEEQINDPKADWAEIEPVRVGGVRIQRILRPSEQKLAHIWELTLPVDRRHLR